MFDARFRADRLEPSNGNGQLVNEVGGNRLIDSHLPNGLRFSFPEPHAPISEADLMCRPAYSTPKSVALRVGEAHRQCHPARRAEALGLALTVDPSSEDPGPVSERSGFFKALFFRECSHVDGERFEELFRMSVERLDPHRSVVGCRLAQCHRCQPCSVRRRERAEIAGTCDSAR